MDPNHHLSFYLRYERDVVLILTVLMFLLSGCPPQSEAKKVSTRGNLNVKLSTTNTQNQIGNAPSFETDELNGDDDDDDGDDGNDEREEKWVNGTEDCLIKKGHSLECKPEQVSGIDYNNQISDKDKDSEGKVLN